MMFRAFTLASSSRQMRRSFTLTELMVAVAVLIVVIIATSKIFGTASQVTSTGAATINMLTEAAAIERQIRDDIAKLTHEGFFAIRNVAVRNDVNGPSAPLLNPNLPSGAVIRADQLVFFANGVESSNNLMVGEYVSHKGQGITSRVYYGHAFQLPEAYPVQGAGTNIVLAHDPVPGVAITPWFSGNVAMVNTRFSPAGDAQIVYSTTAGTPSPINATQPEARKWILARQNILLVDDDTDPNDANSKTVYLGEIQSARSIFHSTGAPWGISTQVRSGRVDAAASELHDIRRWVQYFVYPPVSPSHSRPWNDGSTALPDDGRAVISKAIYYPRAERRAPSMHRVDQSLTNHAISSACSSFIVEWTYEKGVGDVDPSIVNSPPHPGLRNLNTAIQQPWFGLRDDTRSVVPMQAATVQDPPWLPPNISPLLPLNMEVYDGAPDGIQAGVNPIESYWAIFGYNQTQSLNAAGNADPALGYTPFPSALRITMTLHDHEGKLEGGREFQFVVKLPKRPG